MMETPFFIYNANYLKIQKKKIFLDQFYGFYFLKWWKVIHNGRFSGRQKVECLWFGVFSHFFVYNRPNPIRSTLLA